MVTKVIKTFSFSLKQNVDFNAYLKPLISGEEEVG